MPPSQRPQFGYAVWSLIFALLGLLVGASVGGAAPSSIPLVKLPHAARKLTAYGGYVVFSQYDPSARDWRLMVWRAGSIKALAVPVRGIPFDAGAGPDANGRPAVVYSRCAQDPPPPAPFELLKSEDPGRPDWARARGCRIYELSLPNGSPVLVKAIRAPGASDSTPAIWNGDIAFGRLAAGSHIARIYLWHHHSGTRLDRLGGGRGPSCLSAKAAHPAGKAAQLPPGLPRPPDADQGRCESNAGGPPSAWVAGMSLDGGALAYEWFAEVAGPLFGLEGAQPEIRIDPLREGRQSAAGRVAETSFVSGTCGAVFGSSPNAVGNSVLYSRWDDEQCGREGPRIFSSFVSYTARTNAWRTAHASGGLIAAIAQDHATTYWIGDVPTQEPPLGGVLPCRPTPANVVCSPRPESTSDCDPAHGTCTLMQTKGLVFGAPRHRPPIGPA
jgi:hypothetical protein